MGGARNRDGIDAGGAARRGARDGRAPQASPARSPATRHAAILAAVRAIPAGNVAAYGVVAQRAGLPGCARLVARVLAESGEDGLPWHRVLRADGRIAFPPGSEAFVAQAARLRAEGVEVDARGRVRVARRARMLDEALWAVD